MSTKILPKKLGELVRQDGVVFLPQLFDDLPRLGRRWGFVPTPAQARQAVELLESSGQVVVSHAGYIRPADRMRTVQYARYVRIGPASAFKRYNRKAGPWRGRRTVGPDGRCVDVAEGKS